MAATALLLLLFILPIFRRKPHEVIADGI
jgi:hypothetical protein